jgi:ferric-dicitrate binding protein FerR (iron transport regulator)
LRVIIAGSRTLNNSKYVETAVSQAFNKWMQEDQENWKAYTRPEIVSGGAQGVDFQAELYAKKHTLPFKEFKADWDKHGKKAGILRNIEMAKYADALIAIWDGKSKGTLHMICDMVSKQKPVFVYCP